MKPLTWRSMRIVIVVLIAGYGLVCLYLLIYQRNLIFQPQPNFLQLPDSEQFKLPYEEVGIPVPDSSDRLHGWWIPAPTPQEKITVLPDEPVRVLKSPKTILFLCGAGGNKSYFLARLQGLRQLGFSILVVDYRGYGQSQGGFPTEVQLYQDSKLAYQYLTETRRVLPDQIVVYGESLGGAIAIELATHYPAIAGLIVQSSFTSMAAVAKQRPFLWLFPIDVLLTQRFHSLPKLKQLRLPILFIHGTADKTVPVEMSQQLYEAASEPKYLHLIPDAEHVRIYRPGKDSYLKAIQRFVELIPKGKPRSF